MKCFGIIRKKNALSAFQLPVLLATCYGYVVKTQPPTLNLCLLS